MPNQPKTPLRGFRCPDELWEAAQAKSAAEGRDLSTVMRELLSKWVMRPPRKRS